MCNVLQLKAGNKKNTKIKQSLIHTHTQLHTTAHTKRERERDVGIICVKIYDDLSLEKREKKREIR